MVNFTDSSALLYQYKKKCNPYICIYFFQPVECGHYVAVREKIDGTFYAFRGQILDEIKNKDKIKVFLVDFGDTIEVREKDIRPLPQEFASFPQFAVPCCLKNVEPLQGKVVFSAMFCLLAVLIYLFVQV